MALRLQGPGPSPPIPSKVTRVPQDTQLPKSLSVPTSLVPLGAEQGHQKDLSNLQMGMTRRLDCFWLC